MMPRLDGLALLRLVEERDEPIPFILMSAAVTPRSSTATFVPKPFDIDTMLQIVQGSIAGAPEVVD
jgi:DNA-binding NtrC family response regulator